ncbi:MAG: class I SAM-dependent methyltransferase [Candidatus Sungbacteria bacterium]|uniref:Class I SAM-dependent methyltransferase n=1 Tax=Candidatus Sungiibacteriota bacterium TaxID=2750080 RepID=A0A932R1C4_9BACT|nr:class I SAM-dependent methyltransferase [Candidatus Sungbacteria bacterium]
MQSSEDFKPISNSSVKGPLWLFFFYFRRLIDLQMLTIFLHLRRFLKEARGTMLDVGCGDCIYQEFLEKSVKYIGIDIHDAESFNYGVQSDIIRFDDTNIPLPSESVDNLICSEVLEHVSKPEPLIEEMRRVLKPGGRAVITIPWSARFHYIPHDYARYTPSKLKELFSAFEIEAILPRGTDVAVIGSKMVVFAARQAVKGRKIVYWKLPLLLIASPVFVLALLWGHCGVWFGWGSTDDPLGYTINIRKT